MKKVFLYYHSLRYLKPIQIGYRVYYSFFKKHTLPRVNKRGNLEINFLKTTHAIPAYSTYTDKNTFCFLNKKKEFKGDIDWLYNEFGKLWTYNLNYFDFLHQKNLKKEEGLTLINQFIEKTPINNVGLEAYPISLRGINWILFLSKYEISTQSINTSLYQQYELLFKKLEYHLLGNHLLENAYSLLIASYYFKDSKFYAKAYKILKRELSRQLLGDGAHFELSPMYHQILLNKLLICIEIIQLNPWQNDDLQSFLQQKAVKMLDWLEAITFENGDIPLVNDSAKGIVPTTNQIREYAKNIQINSNKKIELNESGYRKIKKGNYEIVIDIGKIQANYIPGHTHSDLFSFVLYINKNPFIIDTGISTYSINKRREFERSTEAHNTVKIKGLNSFQTWSSFRVGKRVIPIIIKDNENEVVAEINYKKPKASHRRHFKFNDNSIIIEDTVSSKHKAVAHFHFAPTSISKLKKNSIIANEKKITFSTNKCIENKRFKYAEEYNILKASEKIEVSFDSILKTEITI